MDKSGSEFTRGSALFLDRDGIINIDRGSIHRPDQFEFVPGIFQLARFWATKLRRPIVVVTNQSGIGRGYFDERAYAELTRWMCGRFAAENVAIARVYHCPYHPVHGIGEYRRDHPWRKPNPGMILQAIADLALDPARCVIVGDQMIDIEAGAAAGLGLRILLAVRSSKRAEGALDHEVVADLGETLELLRSRFASTAATGAAGMLAASAIPGLNLTAPSAMTVAQPVRAEITDGQRCGDAESEHSWMSTGVAGDLDGTSPPHGGGAKKRRDHRA
jgi:D-glycero-D-manno-heptose 1,7-bisphosphate phosphatase